MDAVEQRRVCQVAKLFSRVEPAHKSKIVDYLQKDGAVSAMVRDDAHTPLTRVSAVESHLRRHTH